MVSVVGNINRCRFRCAVNANIFKSSTGCVAATVAIGDRWRIVGSYDIEGMVSELALTNRGSTGFPIMSEQH